MHNTDWKEKLQAFSFIYLGIVFLKSPWAFAIQRAEVFEQNAIVYQSPKLDSTQLASLEKGVDVLISSGQVKDRSGQVWYKIRIPNGGLGYIRSGQVRTLAQLRTYRQARVLASESSAVDSDQAHPAANDPKLDSQRTPWSYVIRVMGVGAVSLANPTLQGVGEGEFSRSIPFGMHGYWHRIFSLGAFYLPIAEDPVIGASGIIRIFTQTRIEPELRIRVGSGLRSNQFSAGLNLGVSYPFSLNFERYLSGYVETGALRTLNGSNTWIWGSAGIGFHF